MSVVGRLKARIAQPGVGRQWGGRTVRMRLTLFCGMLFLLSGAVLVAVTYGLFERATRYAKPQLPRIPQTPSIEHLRVPLPSAATAGFSSVVKTLPQLARDQYQLGQDQHQLVTSLPKGTAAYQLINGRPLLQILRPLEQDQHQLARDQHQLATAVSQLASAVHQVARSRSAEAAQRAADSHQLLIDSGIALAIVGMLALLAGWLAAGRMLRPLRTITRKAQRIASTSLHERLALEGPQDELKELGDTLDDLLARLDAAFDAQRQFVANTSHELRAPLTRQRALIQVALADPEANVVSLRAAHERVLASEQHLEQMIDGLLALSRGQTGLERSELLDLASVVDTAVRMRTTQIDELGLDLHVALDPAPTIGDPRLIERLATNLLDNAIRHNTTGGSVEVVTSAPHGCAYLLVSNTGPVIAPAEISRLFEPFQRLDGARTSHDSGHGLGLSIVQAVADAHHAQLDASAPTTGGLTIEISFPPAPGTVTEQASVSATPAGDHAGLGT
jgi:signal transduction histidine kinase